MPRNNAGMQRRLVLIMLEIWVTILVGPVLATVLVLAAAPEVTGFGLRLLFAVGLGIYWVDAARAAWRMSRKLKLAAAQKD